MTWDKNYRLYAVEMHTVPMAGAEIISGISEGGINANSEVTRETTVGNLYAEAASLQGLRPVASFTTYNIAQAIDTLGIGGAASCVTSDGTHPGIKLYFAAWECAGPKSGVGSNHRVYNVKEGILVPRQLTVEHRGNARISYDLYCGFDGTNAPVLDSEQDTLPTLTNDAARWTMGPMTIGGVTVEGKKSITLDFGPSVSQEGADSDFYDSVTSLDNLLPQLRVAGVDPFWLDNVAILTGKSVVRSNTTVVLRKRNTTDVTAEHIQLAISGLVNWDEIIRGSQNSPATIGFNIDLTTDPTDGANPIVPDTTYAIP